MATSGGTLFVSLLLLVSGPGPVRGWEQPGRVLLREVQVLTLYRDQYTTSRRTSPVPQLQCIGGTARCAYVPAVVQCRNQGWDGFDIQWECKADLDNSYRFGRIEVSCEGYDYPDDPYILGGSCGLQYALEITEEGQRRANSFGSFGSSYFQSSTVNSRESSDSTYGVIVIIVLLFLAYGCYKLFLSNHMPQQDFANDGYSRMSWENRQTPPPPPGFKSSFTGAGGFGGGSSYEANSGPGFWTGLGTGGLLGYLAGNQRAQTRSSYFPYTGPTAPPPTGGNFSGSTGPSTSGARTASGYGGTKRR